MPGGPTFHLTSSLPAAAPSAGNILVVGGTDGSGTRRVVQLLAKLGVTVVSEDPETYDIHADLFGGWPNVVTPVLTVRRFPVTCACQQIKLNHVICSLCMLTLMPNDGPDGVRLAIGQRQHCG